MTFCVLWSIVPFCDTIAYGYIDYDVIFGFMSYCFHGLLAILSAHRETQCDRWCEGPRYLVPNASLPIYLAWSICIVYLGMEKYKIN